jgi:hypothetical protein
MRDDIAREGVLCALALIEHLIIYSRINHADSHDMMMMVQEMRERLSGEEYSSQDAATRRVVASTTAREYWGY